MTHDALARGLKEHLGLEHEPVAVAPAASVPAMGRSSIGAPTSACSLWRRAEKELFFASAEDHSGCSVGAYVMGLPMSAPTAEGLGAALKMMADVHYLGGDEVPAVPSVQEKPLGVLYGPLKDFPGEPRCVVLWTTPAQAMLLSEALGTAEWSVDRQGGLRVMGRPGCGAVANSCNTGGPSLSLGCSGMRLFTEIEPTQSLFVVPGAALGGLLERVRSTVGSNEQMLVEYRRKKAAMAA